MKKRKKRRRFQIEIAENENLFAPAVSIDDRRERGPISSGPFLRHTVELERKQPKD
jgi:hypothetical protein